MSARSGLTCNDTFLFGALGYSMVVLVIKWSDYANCGRPLQLWLLVDYATIIIFRMSHFVSQYYSTRYPPSEFAPRCANFMKVVVIYGFFWIWSIVGTVWFAEVGSCLPQKNQFWTFVIWLVLCYLWLAVYACLLGAQYAIRSGRRVGFMGGRAAQQQFRPPPPHLTPQQIDFIPLFSATGNVLKLSISCSICIDDFVEGVPVKRMPNCGHDFHASCVDEWLARHNTCPNCRVTVEVRGRLPLPSRAELGFVDEDNDETPGDVNAAAGGSGKPQPADVELVARQQFAIDIAAIDEDASPPPPPPAKIDLPASDAKRGGDEAVAAASDAEGEPGVVPGAAAAADVAMPSSDPAAATVALPVAAATPFTVSVDLATDGASSPVADLAAPLSPVTLVFVPLDPLLPAAHIPS